MNFIIRKETASDYAEITTVNNLAFGQDNEGKLIHNLRNNPAFVKDLSIVAEHEGRIIGHILFFPISIKDDNGIEHKTLSLAPMSVHPGFQKQGIGSKLVKSGIIKANDLGHNSIVVLGHPKYYPKFGFKRASFWDIKSPFNAPDEAFMAIELKARALSQCPGTVVFPKEYYDCL